VKCERREEDWITRSMKYKEETKEGLNQGKNQGRRNIQTAGHARA
jgi:hypothetical protein